MAEPQSNVVREDWNEKAKAWAGFARDEESYWTQRAAIITQAITRHIKSGDSLDVGCGAGQLCSALQDAGFEAHGADISENMVTNAAELLSERVDDANKRFRVCVDGEFPFCPSQDRFQLITAIGMLQFIEKRADYIHRLSGVLDHGGYLVVSNSNAHSLYVRLAVLSRYLRFWKLGSAEWRATIKNLSRTGIWSGGYIDYERADPMYSADELDRLLQDAGLEPVDSVDFYYFDLLDRNPLGRKGLNAALARKLAWNHVAIYRKPD